MLRFGGRGLVVVLGMQAVGGLVASGCNSDDNGSAAESDGASATEVDGTSEADGTSATEVDGALPDASERADHADTGTDGASDGAMAAPDAPREADAMTGADGADASVAADGGVDAHAADVGADAPTDALVEAASDALESAEAEAPLDAATEAAVVDANGLEGSADGAIPADASTDSGAPPVTTYSIIASALGQNCADDARDIFNCLEPGATCEDATGSTADGTLQQLCYATLACSLGAGQCAFDQDFPEACYCGDIFFTSCQAGAAAGVCLTAEQAGLETMNPSTLGTPYYTDPSTGGGIANAIDACLIGVPRCIP